jgi:hypothetical protein
MAVVSCGPPRVAGVGVSLGICRQNGSGAACLLSGEHAQPGIWVGSLPESPLIRMVLPRSGNSRPYHGAAAGKGELQPSGTRPLMRLVILAAARRTSGARCSGRSRTDGPLMDTAATG